MATNNLGHEVCDGCGDDPCQVGYLQRAPRYELLDYHARDKGVAARLCRRCYNIVLNINCMVEDKLNEG